MNKWMIFPLSVVLSAGCAKNGQGTAPGPESGMNSSTSQRSKEEQTSDWGLLTNITPPAPLRDDQAVKNKVTIAQPAQPEPTNSEMIR